jgi:hypothetical protein
MLLYIWETLIGEHDGSMRIIMNIGLIVGNYFERSSVLLKGQDNDVRKKLL